jgi:NifU-like protein involved in Fe-S cluster formation/bacterioferritin-associated ferredoxin
MAKKIVPKTKNPKLDVVNKIAGGSWAYTDAVKDHFFNPRNLLWEAPDVAKYDAEGIVGSPACILSSTNIQRNSELVSITEVCVGERVLGHDGRFHNVRKIFRPRHDGSLVQIKNQLGEIACTLDHLVFAMPIPRKGGSPFVRTNDKKKILPSWVHAGDLKKGDIVLYPIPKIIHEITGIKLPPPKRKTYDFRSRAIPPKVQINEEVLELFGYFIAEGHTTRDDKVVGFTFGSKEGVYASRVAELVQKYFGLSSSVKKRLQSNRIDVAVYSVHLARIFREWFGAAAATKRIPGFVLFCPPHMQKGIIRGLWRGDGYFSGERLQPRAGFKTISETLARQVIWLLLRQRIVPSLYGEKSSVKGKVNHQKSYQIHVGDMPSLETLASIMEISFKRSAEKYHTAESWFDDDYLHVPIRKVSKITFEGRLSNFEVEESHSYVTDAFLVHNCGDVMRVWLKIDPKKDKITEFKWRTFGCASAIASTSMLSLMATEKGGMKIEKALKIKPQDIMKRLGGLPDRKIHCSVLGDKALRAAINQWFKKTGQLSRVIVEGTRLIDPDTKVTEADIEEAVLEGATTLEAVQQRTKVGIGNPQCIPEAEELIRFYREKYFGLDAK